MMQTTTIFGGYLKNKVKKNKSKRVNGGGKSARKKPTLTKPFAASLTTTFLGMLNTVKLYHWIFLSNF